MSEVTTATALLLLIGIPLAAVALGALVFIGWLTDWFSWNGDE